MLDQIAGQSLHDRHDGATERSMRMFELAVAVSALVAALILGFLR